MSGPSHMVLTGFDGETETPSAFRARVRRRCWSNFRRDARECCVECRPVLKGIMAFILVAGALVSLTGALSLFVLKTELDWKSALVRSIVIMAIPAGFVISMLPALGMVGLTYGIYRGVKRCYDQAWVEVVGET